MAIRKPDGILRRGWTTGACATAAVAYRQGLVDAEVDVTLPGGTMTIRHDAEGGIHMAGPASESYRGSFDLDDFS